MIGPGNYNEKKAIKEWVDAALRDPRSNLTDEEREDCRDVAYLMIDQGWWRGDISKEWVKMGFGPDKIHDLYL